jgi:hypothetical protein
MVALPGCTGEVRDDEAVGVAQEASLSMNSLSMNSLSMNSLSMNSLSMNSLSMNSLSMNSLSALQDPSPTGDLFRELVSYTVGCALNPSQSFSFSWTDAEGNLRQTTDVGQLGLAPDWANGPLTSVNEQQSVSACLAARTNYFGVTVPISVRGLQPALLETTTQTELAQYPYVEGAFWGNIFAPTPYLASCDDTANAAHSEADQRVCATGYLDANGNLDACGMIALAGSCDSQCLFFDSWNQLYVGCGGSWNAITIGLQ